MSDFIMDVEYSLKVMINKEKGKVLFAEANSQFVDLLLRILTLPLGSIVNVLDYLGKALTVGSLRSLFHSIENLDDASFVTEGAKHSLLNPITSECEMRKLEKGISDYDFTMHTEASFIISDDLQILPIGGGLFQIITILGIPDMDMDKAEPITMTIGLNQVYSLLKASFVSETPLSDLMFNVTGKTNSFTLDFEPKRWIESEIQENPNSKKTILKAVLQKSNGKFLYAQAEEEFVEFLFGFSNIPVGAAEHLVGGSTGSKAIDNLYRSATDVIDDKYFKSPDKREMLRNPNLPRGRISKDYILPLNAECEPVEHVEFPSFLSSLTFPKGQGKYLNGLRTYHVTDDLTVTPFCLVSILCSLREMKIPISDVKEVELEIGLKQTLSILRASFTSTCAIMDALLSRKSSLLTKQPKREV